MVLIDNFVDEKNSHVVKAAVHLDVNKLSFLLNPIIAYLQCF